MARQATDVCGINDAAHHAGELTRLVLALQPVFGDGVGLAFTHPVWEEEVTLCDYHRTSPEFQETPEDEDPPDYHTAFATTQGLPVRLVWTGEIVEE